jgi:hypothetical protein
MDPNVIDKVKETVTPQMIDRIAAATGGVT